MDTAPAPDDLEAVELWDENRSRVSDALEENGLRYYRFGRVLPEGDEPEASSPPRRAYPGLRKPTEVTELLEVIIRRLRRAMHPLSHRRKGAHSLLFQSEYDVQDLLHAMLRPWIRDIRPEEFTPSYAGTSTRMDFLLPAHSLVIETKIVRTRAHAQKIGDELIIDISHYQRHAACAKLWCVVYDPHEFVTNAHGLLELNGLKSTDDSSVDVTVFVL